MRIVFSLERKGKSMLQCEKIVIDIKRHIGSERCKKYDIQIPESSLKEQFSIYINKNEEDCKNILKEYLAAFLNGKVVFTFSTGDMFFRNITNFKWEDEMENEISRLGFSA